MEGMWQSSIAENEDQIQSLVKFSSGEPQALSRPFASVPVGFLGYFGEVSGTEGTIVNSGERFNELQVFRMRDEKRLLLSIAGPRFRSTLLSLVLILRVVVLGF
jgi:hypothetical protein